LKNISDKVYQ